MRSVAPKYGAAKRGPKPKSKAKPAVREPTGDGPIMILVREILSGMKGLEPDITAGWCANVESAAAAMESGATVQDWLGTSSEEAQVTMKAFVAEMGVRAPEGRGPQWRNWARVFSIRLLTQLYPDVGLASEITGLEPILANNAELHTVFTTPRATRELLDPTLQRQDEGLDSAKGMMEAMGRRQEEGMRLQKEMMEMLGSLSGRVTQLEGKPHTAPTEATAGSKSGTTGLNELEQRLAGVRTVMAGDAAQLTRTPATSGVESRGPGKTSPSEDAKTNDKADAIAVRYRRMEHLSKNPLQVLLPLAKGYRVMEDWPFAGTAAADRVAPDYLATVYRGGRRGVDYAEDWIKNHGLSRNHMAQQMRHELGVIDQMLLYDGIDIVNSSAAEMICRRCYALERVFDDVHCEADWKTDKKEHNKTKLTMMDEYDVTAVMSRGEPSPDADATVRKRMEMRAQFNKYLGKQALQKEGWS